MNVGSPKDDAGVTSEGKYSPFSPAKHRHNHHHYPHHWHGYQGPPMGGARYQKYSYHHRASPPFDMHRGSPPFLPNVNASNTSSYHGDKRHWMRGPDLVKA